MLARSVLAFGLASLALSAQALTVTQWNFNSSPPDASGTSGSTAASTGSGVVSLLGTTATFASGFGSTDTAATDNTAWNLAGFAAQGTGDKTRGLQALVSTAGFENIVISYDGRHSGTASRYELLQYTLDGSSYLDFATFDTTAFNTFAVRSFDLSAVAGVSDNASFGFRIVSTFAPGGSTYAPTDPSATYGTAGTWRFDMLTVSGTAIAAVPEPGSLALLLAGLGAVGFAARRRAV